MRCLVITTFDFATHGHLLNKKVNESNDQEMAL